MKIEVCIKSVYGEPKVYPACAQAKLLAELIGVKTFPPAKLQKIKQLGYEVVQVPAFELAFA